MPLEKDFEKALFDVYRRAKDDAGYNASAFLQMLMKNGGVITAKRLINSPAPSHGYTQLHLLGRLDLTVEATVLENPKWHSLFSEDELTRARKRLEEYKYLPK
jgi:hypothetical protein